MTRAKSTEQKVAIATEIQSDRTELKLLYPPRQDFKLLILVTLGNSLHTSQFAIEHGI